MDNDYDQHPEKISIHAPPRGATGVSFSCLLWFFISIHAPPRGATGRVVFLSFVVFHFNSRPSARGDPAYRAVAKIY